MENVNILKNYNLYGMNDIEKVSIYQSDFDLTDFYRYCVDREFCLIDEDSRNALYTEKGRELFGEASQYAPFQRFAAKQLKTTSLGEKYDSVKERLIRILSSTESKDTSKSRLLQIKELFEEKHEELGTEEQKRCDDFKLVLSELEKKYAEWYANQLDHQSVKYTDSLLESVFDRFEEQISAFDFIKEIGSSLTPPMFKKGKESPVSKKISGIISDSVEKVFPEHIEKLVNKAYNEIESILIRIQSGIIAKRNEFDTKVKSQNLHINDNIDSSRIMESMQKIIKHLGKNSTKEFFIKIAQKDLRKGSNNFFKKKIIKPIVTIIRNLLKKLGIKWAKKKAAKTTGKAALGPWGWALVIWDLATMAKDLNDMYKEMKSSLKEQLGDEPSFKEIFKSEAENIYKRVVESVKKQLIKDFSEDTQDLSYILTGLSVCDNAIEEFNNIEQKL